MNERIQELYLHAFPPSLNDSTTVQMSAEKFAELLVRDVLAEVLQAMDDGMDVYYTVAGKFGVE